jgi:hypothetical protein
MAKFSIGRDSEDRLVTLLVGYGCKILQDDVVDLAHKLDFILLDLPSYPRLLDEQLGVQVTNQIGNVEKQSDFFRRASHKPYAPRNLYLELDPDLDLENGGAFLALVALTAFLTDDRFKDQKIGAARIGGDLTYHFMETKSAVPKPLPVAVIPQKAAVAGARTQQDVATPAKPISSARTASPVDTPKPKPALPQSTVMSDAMRKALNLPDVPVGTSLMGDITRYNSEGSFGFVATDRGTPREQSYFFHRNNITDDTLKLRLDEISRTQKDNDLDVPIPVSFHKGTPGNEGKYSKAVSVSLLKR